MCASYLARPGRPFATACTPPATLQRRGAILNCREQAGASSASAMSCFIRRPGIPGYSREASLADLIDEAEADIRGALHAGSASVQIDFTEGRLSLKLDPSGQPAAQLYRPEHKVSATSYCRRPAAHRAHVRLGVTDDFIYSGNIDYVVLVSDLFELDVGRFYLQMASERDKKRILRIVSQFRGRDDLVFIPA